MPKKFFHSWGNWEEDTTRCIARRVCTKPNCDYCWDERESHDYSKWEYESANSCRMKKKCVRCNKTEYKDEEHIFDEWKYHTAGSCEQKRSCKRCNYTEYRLQHQYGKGAIREKECIIQHKCSRCGDIFVKQAEHQWSRDMLYEQCIQQAISIYKNRKDHLLNILEGWSNVDLKYFMSHAEVEQINLMLKELNQKSLVADKEDRGKICQHCNFILYLGKSHKVEEKSGFLSYSHHEKFYADCISNTFGENRIAIIRDICDIKIGDHIQEFMNRVKKSKYIVIILSENYLHSVNCMYEAVKAVYTLAKKGCKLFVISIGVNIADKAVKESYLVYWQQRLREGIQQQESPHDIQIYSSIVDNIWEFMTIVTEYKYVYVEEGELIEEYLISDMVRQIQFILNQSLQDS